MGWRVSGWPVVSDVISHACVRKPGQKPKSRRFRSFQDGEPELVSVSPYFGDFMQTSSCRYDSPLSESPASLPSSQRLGAEAE